MPTSSLDLRNSSVLITGGSEGIGRGLAERFLKAGSTVLVTGRNSEKLKRAASELPGLQTLANDISKADGLVELAEYVASTFPKLNVLINNAGIQRRIALAADTASWQERQVEIDTLLSGPIHLNSLLIPLMLELGVPSRIVNVTSGGAFIPQVFAPVYSACKAALHSYTVTLRHALADTSIGVVELIPPAVQTALAGPGSTPVSTLDAFCDQVFVAFQSESEVIGFGLTDTPQFKQLLEAAEPMFRLSAGRFPVATYSSARD